MDPLCLEFMNSAWSDYRGSGRRIDRLEDPEWREGFVRAYSLGVTGEPGSGELARLRDLRSAMFEAVRAIEGGGGISSSVEARLDRALDCGSGYRRRLARDCIPLRVELAPIRRDWEWIESEVASSFVELLSTNDPARIKLCGNADCRWVFLDTSKSRTRRWCADSCGNLLKVRKHRARARSKGRSTG